MPFNLLPHQFLMALSGFCFGLGSIFLAISIRWRGKNLAEGLKGQLSKKLKRAPSQGWTDPVLLTVGIILNGIGYGLLLWSVAISL